MYNITAIVTGVGDLVTFERLLPPTEESLVGDKGRILIVEKNLLDLLQEEVKKGEYVYLTVINGPEDSLQIMDIQKLLKSKAEVIGVGSKVVTLNISDHGVFVPFKDSRFADLGEIKAGDILLAVLNAPTHATWILHLERP